MKKCLVTGAGGFLGAELTRQLIQAGYFVKVLLRRAESATNLNRATVQIFIGDVCDKEAVREALLGVDYVFHAASVYEATPFYVSKPERMYEVNIKGCEVVCEEALKAGVEKVIYTSSAGTIGLNSDGLPSDEKVPLNHLELRSHYERSKALAEALFLSYSRKGLFVVSINPSFLVGPGDARPTPTGEVVVNFLNRKYPCVFDAPICLSSIYETARAHIQALTYGVSGERYIVSEPKIYSMPQLFQDLEEISGIASPKLKIPINWLLPFSIINEAILAAVNFFKKNAKPLISYEIARYLTLGCKYDPTKSITVLKCEFKGLKRELEDSVEWFIRNGYVNRSSRIRYYKKIGKLK